MRILCNEKKELIECAIGKRNCTLVIENCKLVNVFSGEIYKGDVGIYNGFIAYIRDDFNLERIKGDCYLNGDGNFLIPGLIDAHIHIESTLMTPRNFAKAAIPHGTTTVVTDPHEIANVYGVKGVKYMHEASEDLPMRQIILAPSCVPAVLGLENAGAEFFKEEIEELFKLDRVIGLGEIMDFIGVIENDKRITDILDLCEKRGLFMQGHAPFLSDRKLSAYLCAGITSDHESRTEKEAKDKIRNGMYVDARESSISKNVTDIVNGVKDFRYKDLLTLCTDDREAHEILEDGHMNAVVRTAIKAGLHPIDAIKSATLNIGRELGIENIGGIAPGFVADLALVKTLEEMDVKAVIYNGEIVAKDGVLLKNIEDRHFQIEKENSVKVDNIKEDDFILKADGDKVKCNVIKYLSQHSAQTKIVEEEFLIKDGKIILQDEELNFVAVINRHGKNTKALGIVRGFGITKGAVGSTVSHDSHNMTIVYKDSKDAIKISKDLINLKGGLTSCLNGEIKANLKLEVAGLMSTKEALEIKEEASKMKESLRSLGIKEMKNPLLRIVTLALPVIPEGKMSDMGLINVSEKRVINIFK